MQVSFDEQSYVQLNPVYDSEEYETEIYEQGNVGLNKGESLSWLELKDKEGLLSYRLEAPFSIYRLEIKTNPRLFNDAARANHLSAYYSTDYRHFKKVYHVQSNGNQRWEVYEDFQSGEAAGVYERETFDVVYPHSKTVYILFVFEGNPGQVQLISLKNNPNTTMFRGLFDSSRYPRFPLHLGIDHFSVTEALKGNFELNLGTNNFIQPAEYQGAEVLSSSSPSLVVNDQNALEGKARLARIGADPIGLAFASQPSAIHDKGVMRAIFRIKGEVGMRKGKVARLETMKIEDGRKILLATKSVQSIELNPAGRYHEISIDFLADKTHTLQHRLIWLGGTDLSLNFIATVPALEFFKYRDLFSSTGILIEDPSSTSKTVRHGKASVNTVGPFLRGEFEVPPRTSSTLILNLKASLYETSDVLAHINIVNVGKEISAQSEIKGSDIPWPEVDQDFRIDLPVLSDSRNESVFGKLPGGADLTSERLDKITFQLSFMGNGDLAAKTATLATNSIVYQCENSVYKVPMGKTVQDVTASKGFAHYSTNYHLPGHLFLISLNNNWPSGRYRASSRLKAATNTSQLPVAWIDVNKRVNEQDVIEGRYVYATEFWQAEEWQSFNIDFDLDRSVSLVQFRIVVQENVEIWADYIEVFQSNGTINFAKERGNAGLIVFDAQSGEKMRYLNGHPNPAGDLAFTFPLNLSDGCYRTGMRLRTDNNLTTEVVAAASADFGFEKKRPTHLPIHGTDFRSPSKYQTFLLDFHTDGLSKPVMKLVFTSKADIWCDFFYIVPISCRMSEDG